MISIVVPKRRGPALEMNDRTFIDAVLYRMKIGIPWRDFPERFGSWKTVFNRFSNWSRRGHWAAIFKSLQLEFDEDGTIGVARTRFPDVRDVALLDLSAAEAPDDVDPIGVAEEALPSEGGRLAVVAGYGATEELTVGERRLAFVELETQSEETMTTRASGIGGACIGDPGGPSSGATRSAIRGCMGSCRTETPRAVAATRSSTLSQPRGRPRHRRVPRPTIVARSTRPESASARKVAVWCEGGTLVRAACEGAETCGWSDVVVGYRCRPPRDSGCGEYDSWGVCDDGAAKYCDAGSLRTLRCRNCAERCVRRPDTGRVGCELI